MFLTCNTKVAKYPHRSCSPWGAGAIWEIAENRTEGTAGGELRRRTLGVCVWQGSLVLGGQERKERHEEVGWEVFRCTWGLGGGGGCCFSKVRAPRSSE